MIASILAAIFFVLHLAAATGNEERLLRDLVVPGVVSLAFAICSWGVALGIARTREGASVLATLAVTAFGSFGYVVQNLALSWGQNEWDVSSWVLLAWVAMLLTASIIVRHYSATMASASRFTALMMGLLCAFAVSQVAMQVLSSQVTAGGPVASAAVPATSPTDPDRARSIYVIVLDKYTGPQHLATSFGVDNSAFESELRRRGFYVPSAAKANYVHTFLALAGMLNLRYLNELPDSVGEETWSRRPVDGLIENNRLMSTLKAHGYRIIFFPTSYPSTRRNRYADLQIPSPAQVRPEFLAGWLRTTPIPTVHEYACKVVGCRLDLIRYVPESAAFVDWKFSQLAAVDSYHGPVFVFAHLLVPHEPFIYDADCRHRKPYWPLRDDGVEEERVKAAYGAQIQCLNRKLLELVSALEARSTVPPIVIIQADHGHGRLGRRLPPFDDAGPERRSERASVFAAYRFPGVSTATLSDSITPINVMRFLLREYFGDSLPPIEDATYWSSDRHPYRFVRMHHLR